jgi:hypothetical protein
MAKAAKKTKKVKEVVEQPTLELTPLSEVGINQIKYSECEWCFQFDEDKPQVFAWTDDNSDNTEDPKVIFTITNVKDSYITFTNSETGKNFRLFARQLSNEGKALREKQREMFEEQIKLQNEQNGSKNKEA